jgi:hypothetical protein
MFRSRAAAPHADSQPRRYWRRRHHLLLQRQAGGITLHAIGRDIEQSETAVQFNKATCRWTILGVAAEVHRSAERGRVLAALQEAGGPMTPKEIQSTAELSSRNATDVLLSKM